MVFRENGFASDRRGWLRRAEDFVRRNAGVGIDRLIIPRQVHSADVCRIDGGLRPSGDGAPPAGDETARSGNQTPRAEPRAGDIAPGDEMVCDGLVTTTANLMVGVTVADCVPLLAFSQPGRVAGAAHCGWRGIASGIVGEFVGAIRLFAGDAGHMGTVRYLVGPSIGPCCYEVKEDLLSHFEDRECQDHVREVGGRLYFDLRGTVTARLTGLGVHPGQIYVDNTCTSCQQFLLSSYRASGGDCGRMLAYAMLTSGG